MKVVQLENFPAGTNVFLSDLCNMGTLIGQRGDKNRVIVMHCYTGKERPLQWIIVVDELTGERLHITFSEV